MDIVNTEWSFDSLRKLINDHAFAKSVLSESYSSWMFYF